MTRAQHPLTLQLLEWVGERPRSYADAMEAWRSHCPRFTVWEDALMDGLIEVVETNSTADQAEVRLTTQGRAALILEV